MAPTIAERMHEAWRAGKFRLLISLAMIAAGSAYLLLLLSSGLRGTMALPSTTLNFLFQTLALLGFGVIGYVPSRWHGLWGVVRGAALALVIANSVIVVLVLTGRLSAVPAALTAITPGVWFVLAIWNSVLLMRARQ